jgi:hypothetical protein
MQAIFPLRLGSLTKMVRDKTARMSQERQSCASSALLGEYN